MSKKKVFLFSGQGSQYYGMGRELYENNKIFNFWMNECSEIVSSHIGTSLIEMLYDPSKKGEPFDELLYTNPTLISVQYSLFRMLRDIQIEPDYVMGYSLGEITSCIASEVLSLKDGLKLSVEIAKLVEKNTPKAAMLAIMSGKEIIVQNPDIFSNCWLIATNFSQSFVVCGLPEEIQTLQKALQQEGIISQQLPVNNGFHTPLIDPVEDKLKETVQAVQLSKGKVPIVSSKDSSIKHEILHQDFWEVLRYSVNFENAIKMMVNQQDCVFIDLGPSGSLATSVKYILEEDATSVPLQLINQYGKNLQTFEKFKESFSKVQ
ncbi:acyltransferase domain-containing protein [Kordia algicida OT-1]|uniref:Involved in polyketide synthesis n=1 Tax=Kordia algicida OT-1 TaxID=391587 RepID=A9EAD3_9FLAO|nr:acyltransferase domain-containing protein [Kordia algicida]EDP94616.1 involved in polyketide synthesis [Kordia algicida OT-1]